MRVKSLGPWVPEKPPSEEIGCHQKWREQGDSSGKQSTSVRVKSLGPRVTENPPVKRSVTIKVAQLNIQLLSK